MDLTGIPLDFNFELKRNLFPKERPLEVYFQKERPGAGRVIFPTKNLVGKVKGPRDWLRLLGLEASTPKTFDARSFLLGRGGRPQGPPKANHFPMPDAKGSYLAMEFPLTPIPKGSSLVETLTIGKNPFGLFHKD